MDLVGENECVGERLVGSSKTIHRNTREVVRQFVAFVGGFLICFGPFMAMLTLQSSINIKESVGTTAMGIAYAASVAIGIFVSPTAVRRIGSKWVMIFGEMSYLLYISANLYPKRWVMIVAGILVGIGEAFIWTVLPMYLWHFGYFHGASRSKNFELYVRRYTGIFYAVSQCAQIFGNSLSFGILYGIRNRDEMNDTKRFNESAFRQSDYRYCGAQDCQDPNATTQDITHYIPSNSVSLYILIGLFCLLCVGGVIFHAYYLPNAATKHKAINVIDDDFVKLKSKSNGKDITMVSHDGKKELSYCSTVAATFRHAATLKQILLVPLLLYIGLENTIILAEASRSFISCIFGVEQIGIVIIPFAVVNASISLLVPKAIGKFGRNSVMAITLILDLCNYTFCLAWKPEEGNLYLIFLIFLAFAISEPTWKNCTLDVYTHFFPSDQEISYAVWNIWITIGLAIGFLLSPLLCVYSKLYIQIGMVMVSVVFYGLAEWINRRAHSIHETSSTSAEINTDLRTE